MGTSQSSPGSPPKVPLVPPWVPLPDDEDNTDEPTTPDAPPIVPLAPSGRFASARRNLGDFARSGSADSLRKGIGHYVRTGLGGTKTATARMGRTAHTANNLYRALSGSGELTVPGSLLDPIILLGKSAHEVIGAIVEAVQPIDGTLDVEGSRESIRKALSDVLNRFPEASLLSLSENQREFAIECFVALDVYRRFQLDVGKSIQDNAPGGTALDRLREARDYIRETVSAAFRKLKSDGQRIGAGHLVRMVRAALESAFRVFEVYIR